MFEPDLSVNKIINLINNSTYEGSWVDFEGKRHRADLGYVYDFLRSLREYLDKHPEHINKLII